MSRLLPSRLGTSVAMAVVAIALVSMALGASVAEAAAWDQLGKISSASKHLDAAVLVLNTIPKGMAFGGHTSKALGLIAQAEEELKQASADAQKN